MGNAEYSSAVSVNLAAVLNFNHTPIEMTMGSISSVVELLASALVVLTGLYFLGLAVASFRAPSLTARFLLGFAASRSVHYLEQAIRLAVGGAFLHHAPRMLFSGAFSLFGWTLVITTVALLAVPWHWHKSYAEKTVPYAVRHIRILAVASFVLGGLVLAAVVSGPA